LTDDHLFFVTYKFIFGVYGVLTDIYECLIRKVYHSGYFFSHWDWYCI